MDCELKRLCLNICKISEMTGVPLNRGLRVFFKGLVDEGFMSKEKFEAIDKEFLGGKAYVG